MGGGSKCELHFENLKIDLQEIVLIFIKTFIKSLWQNFFKFLFMLIDFLSSASV